MKKVATVGYWLIALSGLLAGQAAWGKPADLPEHNQIECGAGTDDPPPRKFSLDLEVSPKGITLKVETAPEEPADWVAIDPLMPAFIEQWLQHVGDMLARPDRAVNLDALWNRLPHIGSSPAATEFPPLEPSLDQRVTDRAEELFKLAEFYRRTGKLESARFYYQRVHLVAPTSEAGRRAIDRLQEIEERLRSDAEEENNPGRSDEQSMDQEVHKNLIPLGLVRHMF